MIYAMDHDRMINPPIIMVDLPSYITATSIIVQTFLFRSQHDITPIPFGVYFPRFNGILDSTIGFCNVGTIVVFAGAEIGFHFWEIVL